MTREEQNAIQVAQIYVKQLPNIKPGYIRALMFLVGMDIQRNKKELNHNDYFVYQMILTELASKFSDYILWCKYPTVKEQKQAIRDWKKFKKNIKIDIQRRMLNCDIKSV